MGKKLERRENALTLHLMAMACSGCFDLLSHRKLSSSGAQHDKG